VSMPPQFNPFRCPRLRHKEPFVTTALRNARLATVGTSLCAAPRAVDNRTA
jgi:hypothetical protein